VKILFANKFYYPRGGDCIHVFAIKRLLEKNGHHVAIFSMQHPENLPNEFDRFWPSALEYGTKIKSNYIESIRRPIYSSEVKKKWNDLLDYFQPEIVHLHNIHSQISPIIAKESHKRNLPVFWTLHDFKLVCPAYSMLRDGKPCEKCLTDKKNVLKYKCIKNSFGGSLVAYIEALAWTQKKLEKYTTGFIAPSLFLKNKMAEAGFKAEKIRHLHNFNESLGYKADGGKGDYYVYLGRLSGEKGIETLLKVASKIKGVNLKVVGDGPLRRNLEEKYKTGNISFLGYQPKEKVLPIVAKAKFLVLPSECYENNPLSIIESLSCGTPVLGSNIGGIPELIEPDKNGMLFSPGDETDLFLKISKMMAFTHWDYNKIANEANREFNENVFYQQLMEYYSQRG
jgi:glycosyltransferase involved in cell wall biosynthesis